jgi:hypothetical protein
LTIPEAANKEQLCFPFGILKPTTLTEIISIFPQLFHVHSTIKIPMNPTHSIVRVLFSFSLMVLPFIAIHVIIRATKNSVKWFPDVCVLIFKIRNYTTTLSQKFRNWLPTDVVLYLIRTGSGAAPLREPKKEQTLPSCMWRYALVDCYQRFGRTCQPNYMTLYLLRQYVHRQCRGQFSSPISTWNISSGQRHLNLEKFRKMAKETAWNCTGNSSALTQWFWDSFYVKTQLYSVN